MARIVILCPTESEIAEGGHLRDTLVNVLVIKCGREHVVEATEKAYGELRGVRASDSHLMHYIRHLRYPARRQRETFQELCTAEG